MRHNNHAQLVVYDAATQTTVQITGVTSVITDIVETNTVFTHVIYASLDMGKTDIPPITKLDAGDYVAYRLTPKQVRMAVFSKPKSGDYDAIFKTIIPKES